MAIQAGAFRGWRLPRGNRNCSAGVPAMVTVSPTSFRDDTKPVPILNNVLRCARRFKGNLLGLPR